MTASRHKRNLSGILPLLVLAGLAFLFYRWPFLVDSRGSSAPASITEKRETARERFGQWYRRFEIVAAFRTPGNPFERHAICDVVQSTYDLLHPGDPVTVHYLPALLQQPFIPATHLSPCTAAGNFGSNPDLYRRLALVFGSLAGILVIWLILRLRPAGWLLVPWFGFFLAYGVAPRAEPAPTRPRPATATIRAVSVVDELIGGGTGHRGYSRPIRLTHPYQFVQLDFTPAGASEPILALDAVDLNSIPSLAPHVALAIDYDASNPRVARLRAGTREFPRQALNQLMAMYAVMVGLPALLFLFVRSRSRAKQKGGVSP